MFWRADRVIMNIMTRTRTANVWLIRPSVHAAHTVNNVHAHESVVKERECELLVRIVGASRSLATHDDASLREKERSW